MANMARIEEESVAVLPEYGRIPISFEVRTIFEVQLNVPACRLYARHGFTLASINRHAYPELPDEVELIWCRSLPA